MKHLLLPILCCALLASCTPDSTAIAPNEKAPIDSIALAALTNGEPIPTASADTLTYLALGDSYTICESVDPALRWPVQLQQRINMNAEEVVIAYPDIIAQTGWTTANLSNAMDDAGVDDLTYDLVSLLIGVNNQYQGLPLEAYETEYEALLQRAIAIAGGNAANVFVVSIPDYGYTPFGLPNQEEISTELAAFNLSCQTITEAAGVSWYNITPISQQWPDVENLVAPDNLHPSGVQYGLWVDSFWEDVLE